MQSQTGRFNRSEQIALGSATVAALGAFLPWVTVSILGRSATVSGIDGDGVFTLVMTVAAGILVLVRSWDRINKIAITGLGVLTAGFAVMYIVDPAFGFEGSGPMAEAAQEALSPGMGLYVTLLGGVGLVVAGVLDRLQGNTATQGQQQYQQPPQH